MSSSILRRLLSQNTNGGRKFCTAAAAVNRELLEPSSPWLMLPPSFISGGRDMVYNFFSPIKGKVVSFNNRGGKPETDLMGDESTRLVGSSHGWLALYNFRSHDLFLSNPLTGRRVALPPRRGKLFFPSISGTTCDNKVIISCSPLEEDCRAVIVDTYRAASCHPGRSSSWAPLGHRRIEELTVEAFGDLRRYADFVYSAADKMFLGFAYSGTTRRLRQELEGWDVADPVRPRTVRLDRFPRCDEATGPYTFSTCLVSGEQPDQVFVVRRNSCNRDAPVVQVHRVEDGGNLRMCSTLDDLVMFVGINHSFAVKASRFPALKPNSIYFSDRVHLIGEHYIGMFDYQTKIWSSVYYPSTFTHPKYPMLSWFTPTLD